MIMIIIIAFFFLFLQAMSDDSSKNSLFTLSGNIVPRRYDLFFAPWPAKNTFFGTASVTIEVIASLPSPTRSITLHAAELIIKSSDVTALLSTHIDGDTREKKLQCVAIFAFDGFQTITLEFSESLPNIVGDIYTLRFSGFTGIISDSTQTRGLFFCSKDNFLSTQLEPTNARRLFPCFDEPSFRAVFQLTVEYCSSYAIVAGTLPLREELVRIDKEIFESNFGHDINISPEYDEDSQNIYNGSDNSSSHSNDCCYCCFSFSDSTAAVGCCCCCDATGDDDDNNKRNSGGKYEGGDINANTAVNFFEMSSAGSKLFDRKGMTTVRLPENVYKQQQQQQKGEFCMIDRKVDTGARYLRRVVFYETPKISTYIVGFNIGRYKAVSSVTSRRQLQCRAIFPIHRPMRQCIYALNLLTTTVDFFEDFFDISLPLQKLDIIAIDCFNHLGMENWGMITMRTDYMLVDKTSPHERLRRVARLVAHEVAHQWLGNWVCIRNWDYLWMKEGFCRYLEFFFVDTIFPKWMMWGEFLTSVLDGALRADSYCNKTHTVQLSGVSPERIADNFDIISYGKGASILRMLFLFLGSKCLRLSTRLLFQRHGGLLFDSSLFLKCVCDVENNAGAAGCDIAKIVMNHAEVLSHPLLYIERNDKGICCVSQYHMPDLRLGVLRAYLKERGETYEGKELAFMRNIFGKNIFRWNSKKYLRQSNYTLPVRVMELHCSNTDNNNDVFISLHTFVLQKPCDIYKHETDTVVYFNYLGSGIMRCDYDTATWLRIFQMSSFLSLEDRLVITMTLFSLRNVHIGQDCSKNLDRCLLLLKWLPIVTQDFDCDNNNNNNNKSSNSDKNCGTSNKWSYITEQLECLVYIARGYSCWSYFSKFVWSLYLPLLNSGAVSFAMNKRPILVELGIKISKKTSLKILQLCAICRCPIIFEDSRKLVEWAFLSLSLKSLKRINYDSSNIKGNEINNNDNNNNKVDAYCMTVFDVENYFDAAAVSIAMQCLTEHGDLSTWCVLAHIFATLNNISIEFITEELNCKDFYNISVTNLGITQAKCWENMILPALFSYDSTLTISFFIIAIKHIKEFSADLLKAILRNKTLVMCLFETPTLSLLLFTHICYYIISEGVCYCADGSLINQLKRKVNLIVSLLSYTQKLMKTEEKGEKIHKKKFKKIKENQNNNNNNNNSNDSSSGFFIVTDTDDYDCNDDKNDDDVFFDESIGNFDLILQNRIAEMEMNRVWISYCTTYYENFLSL